MKCELTPFIIFFVKFEFQPIRKQYFKIWIDFLHADLIRKDTFKQDTFLIINFGKPAIF